MKFGAVIRSSGERTEHLCIESVKGCLSDDVVHVIRGVTPFSETVKQMLLLSMKNKYDWYIGIDADVVLTPNWTDMVNTVLEGKLSLEYPLNNYYKIEFQLQDKFVLDKYIFRGLHLYNSQYNQQMLNILERTKGSSKPEGNIRHKIGAKFFNVFLEYIGYHGYEQYYRDIFNRFVLRSLRNREDIDRYKLFKTNDEDNVMGRKGWDYGIAHKKEVLKVLDAKNKISISNTGYTEKVPLAMSLKEFYKNVRR